MESFRITRRALCGAGLAMASGAAFAQEPERDISLAQDFDELWETLRDRYCFFGEKRTDWNRVRARYRPIAVAAPSRDAFSAVVKRVTGELYDSHTNLLNGPDGTPRVPPFDLIVDRSGRVTAVQPDSAAADAGLAIGDAIVAVEGVPIETVAGALAPQCLRRPDPAAALWAVNAAVSGGRGRPRALTVRSGDAAAREVAIPLKQRAVLPDVEGRLLEDGIGLIAIRSFADPAAVAAFDAALARMAEARALIIDVRGNGGGDTAVARPIMGRFITARAPYARMRRRAGKGLGAAWTETVDPRGPFTFTRPVVVLADHWSGSMAEGFPMGMRGLGRGTIVGTPMMGLGAAVFRVRLDRTGVEAQYSAEPVYDVNGAARWLMRPDILVADGADILAAGLAEARRRA
ncbi:MAG: S41 family peptidase [Pseudomonadota bacterium]